MRHCRLHTASADWLLQLLSMSSAFGKSPFQVGIYIINLNRKYVESHALTHLVRIQSMHLSEHIKFHNHASKLFVIQTFLFLAMAG